MIKLTWKISGAEQVKVDFDRLELSVRSKLKDAVAQAAERVAAQARLNVNGGVLKAREGKLLGSIGVRLFETPTGAYAKIGTDYYVGRFWERGFRGSQDVRGHLRAIKHGSRFELMRLTRRGKVRTTKVYETGAAQVRGYHRVTDGSPRPWLKIALELVRADFRTACGRIAEGQR